MNILSDKLRSNQANILLWVVFIVGFYYLPFRLLGGFELSMIPGDLGDSVFNLVVLENGFQYLFGSIENFWQSNFLHPFNNPIALSDNLIGTLPIYIILRLTGLDCFTAFQFWILILFTLNYFFSFKAFERLTKQPLWAILGAYIFAFGFYNLNFISHLQLLPRFMLPLTLIWLIEFIFYKKAKSFYFFAAGLIFQFYCGMYLGFFTSLTAIVFMIAYLLIYKKLDFVLIIFKSTQLKITIITSIVSLLILLPLIIPYYEMSTIVGGRTYNEIIENIPSLDSYFFAHPASKIWNPILFDFGVDESYQWWDHTNFVGIMPWLAFLASFILSFKPSKNRQLIRFLVLFVLVFMFLFSKFGELSIYHFFHQLPGLNSMRAINRIVIPLLIVLIVLGVILLDFIRKYQLVLFVTLFLAIFLDNDYHLSWDVNRFPKAKSKTMVNHIKKEINYSNSGIIAFKINDVSNSIYENLDYFNISCMLASINNEIKILNGYSSMSPPGFESFLKENSNEGIQMIQETYSLKSKINLIEIPSLENWK